MPKIFLIKNRLHQQQLRLVEEAQKNTHSGPGGGGGSSVVDDAVGSGGGSEVGSNEPLSLVSRKREHDDSAGKCWLFLIFSQLVWLFELLKPFS